MSKYSNFDPVAFVNKVLKDMRLDGSPPEILEELREAVTTSLSNRILGTVINSFGRNELKIFEKLMKDKPELDEFDALFMTAEKIDGLDTRIEREIDSLHDELVYDMDKIDQISNKK